MLEERTTRGAAPEAMTAVAAGRAVEEARLVEAVLDGSTKAWHELVERYAPRIRRILVQMLACPDDVDSAFVRVLEVLYRSKLASYGARAPLGAWIAAVCRSAAMDEVRAARGRRTPPRGLTGLCPRDRLVFRLYFWEGHDYAAIQHRLRALGSSWTAPDIAWSLDRIRGSITPGAFRRSLYERAALGGACAARELLHRDAVHHDDLRRSAALDPEQRLLREEERTLAAKVRRFVNALPDEERAVFWLWVDRRWTVRRIAEHRGIAPRRVYTTLERVRRRVRAAIPLD